MTTHSSHKMACDTCICAVLAVVVIVVISPANAVFIGDEGSYFRGADGNIETWGHIVEERNQTGIFSNSRTWLDGRVVLPSGQPVRFDLYVSSYKEDASEEDVTIHLQIWCQVSGNNYRLAVDQVETLPDVTGPIAFAVTENINMRAGCYMGVTVEADVTPIQFDYVENYPTYFRLVDNDEYPEVPDTYLFQALPYPSVFSMAVAVDTATEASGGPTGATGPTGRGETGAQGESGEKGDPGDPGPTGEQGEAGEDGPTGDRGPTGPMGPAGVGGEDNEDECDTGNNDCGDDARCVNTVGSFTCECDKGYELDNDNNCEDSDECDVNNGGCQMTCDNSVGSFECSCDDGYTLSDNGYTCVDIDECQGLSTDDCSMICINTPGSYVCLTLAELFGVAQTGEEIYGDGASEAASSSLLGGAGGLVWMIALTIIVFVVMAISFRRWRLDNRRRRHGSDAKSETSSTLSRHELDEQFGGTQYANDGLDAEDGASTASAETPAVLKMHTAC